MKTWHRIRSASSKARRWTFALALASAACGGSVPPAAHPVSLDELRSSGRGSKDGEKVGRWLLDEMLAPGGTAKGAKEARDELAKAKELGLYGGLGAGLYDAAHGRPKEAARAYVAALVAAKSSDDPSAPLVAWVAANRLVALRGNVTKLWETSKASIAPLLEAPGNVGWRALAELHEWAAAEAFDEATVTGDAYDKLVTERMGCVRAARIAGPFGRGTAPERRKSFPAERAPWPPAWRETPDRGTVPRVLKTERHRCLTTSKEAVEDGVFYIETFFDTSTERDLLVAVQGSVAVWVDDLLVAERDLRAWGIWQRYGAAVHVPKGRHRLVARIVDSSASIRLLNLDGTAAKIVTDTDASKPYGLDAPSRLEDPNPIAGYVADLGKRYDGKHATATPLLAALVAHAAHIDGLDDVASAMLTPLLTPKDAAPLMLAMGAGYAGSDVAFPEQVRRTNEKQLYTRAAAADPGIWYTRAWLLLDDAEQRGLVEGVDALKQLAKDTPDVADVTAQLARLYGRLGWRAERMRTIEDLAARFPDNRDVLRLYAGALDDDGSVAEADAVAKKLKALDPDSEIDLDRAIARQDWEAAIAELKRLEKRRPDRKDVAERIADLLMRSGDPSAAAKQLEKALAKNPADATTRLRIADHAYATGDSSALRRALAEALQAGSKGDAIRDAIELIEGASALEPYRVDGRKVIEEFKAWEKRGKHMEGNAARVLDYAATWVHPDGSSEMLEHEILRMQSQEAVGKESEQAVPEGLVLRLRVIKPDGSILEPEPVEGKPTLTMPHLEVGDYVEIEHITSTSGDGNKGLRYRGPHWFFREADKGYWRSEFVVLTPKDKELQIETVGQVPPPKVTPHGMLVERRWRVDESPPAPEEPDSTDPREFLPSVRIGWGLSLEGVLDRYVDAASPETPLDPRLRVIAENIVSGIPAAKTDERARALYTFLADELQDGNENDGRRAITGRSGSRQSAFSYLLRLVGIPVELGLVKSSIAMPPKSKMSEIESFNNLLTRVATNAGARWLSVDDKFAPFGYVPPSLRNEPAIRLVQGTPRETTPTQGEADGVRLEGKAILARDGSAKLELVQSYSGRMGIRLREVFDRIPQGRRREIVETQILAANIPGATLHDLTVENAENLAAPLVLRMNASTSQLARTSGSKLILRPIFQVKLEQIASLAERQTPLLIAAPSHVEVRFEIAVPNDVELPAQLPHGKKTDADRSVTVDDAVAGHSVVLSRVVDVPAGRVQPGADYARFVAFTREATELLESEIALGR